MHSRRGRSPILSKMIFRNIDRTVRNTDRPSLISGYTLYYQIMLHPMFDMSTIGLDPISKLRFWNVRNPYDQYQIPDFLRSFRRMSISFCTLVFLEANVTNEIVWRIWLLAEKLTEHKYGANSNDAAITPVNEVSLLNPNASYSYFLYVQFSLFFNVLLGRTGWS
jgi:hypothetical protein